MNPLKAFTLKYNKLLTILIVLAPIINQYKFPVLSFLELIALLATISKFQSNPQIKVDRYLCFAIWGLFTMISSPIVLMIMNTQLDFHLLNYLLRMIKYMVVLIGIGIGVSDYFDYNYAKEVYKKIVLIVTCGLYIQYILYLFSGKLIYGLIPNMTLNYNNGINSTSLITETTNKVTLGYYYRPSSFFIEPAHYALFVIPWIGISLFDNKNIDAKNLLLIIFVTLGALLTTSSLALLGCVIIWGCFFVRFIGNAPASKNKIISIPILLIISYVTIKIILQNQGIATSIIIKRNSFNDLNEKSSVSLRLLRGWFYFLETDPISKILGVGYGNLSTYYQAKKLELIYDEGLLELSYMSGFTTILNSFGVIGSILYIKWIIQLFNKSEIITRILIITLVAFLITSDCYDSASYWLLFSLIVAKYNLNNNEDSRLKK